MGVKVEDLETLDIQETGWQNKSHLTFALEGIAASPLQSWPGPHPSPAGFSECAQHDAGMASTD